MSMVGGAVGQGAGKYTGGREGGIQSHLGLSLPGGSAPSENFSSCLITTTTTITQKKNKTFEGSKNSSICFCLQMRPAASMGVKTVGE